MSNTRCSQRCEHPGFPGARSVCNVLVPWTNPSPVRSTGVRCGTAKGPWGLEWMYRIPGALSGCVVQYMRGTKVQNAVFPTLRTPRIPRSKLCVQRTGSLD
eukprot:1063570-Prorocentrum_minimum.AAC.3